MVRTPSFYWRGLGSIPAGELRFHKPQAWPERKGITESLLVLVLGLISTPTQRDPLSLHFAKQRLALKSMK